MDLAIKYRPKKLEDIVGQDDAVRALRGLIAKGTLPHAMMFTGPSGTGKTTAARCLQQELKCGEFDFKEMNAADFGGIDDVRKHRDTLGLASWSGGARIWLIDEGQGLTTAAQNCILKMLEEPRPKAYVILATTHDQKIIKAVKTRCSLFKFNPVPPDEIRGRLRYVASKEKIDAGKAVLTAICNAVDGSMRTALNMLQKVSVFTKERDQLRAVQESDPERESIEIARKLLDGRTRWVDLAPVVKAFTGDPERCRRHVLGYAAAVAMNGRGAKRVLATLTYFREPFYDCGKPGLVLACMEACQT